MWCLSLFPLLSQQKKPETPLEPTNPFLEDESGEDNVSEKDEDLDRVRLLIFICTLLCRNDHICTICSLLHPSSDRNWYRIWCHSNMQFTFLSNVVWFDSHLNYSPDQAHILWNWCVVLWKHSRHRVFTSLYLPSIYQTLNVYFNTTAWLWLSYCILISFYLQIGNDVLSIRCCKNISDDLGSSEVHRYHCGVSQ